MALRSDSLFTVFENFHQDFIQNKHLRGKPLPMSVMEMTLDEKLKLYSETLNHGHHLHGEKWRTQ